MQIADLRVVNLRFTYEPGAGYQTPRGRTTGGLSSFVEVTLDNGMRGIGPVYTHPNILELLVEHQFKPYLVGRDPTDIERHWETMYTLSRWYGRKGAALSALGGVDSALWDLRGKLEGKPVYELLGGSAGVVDAYASDLLWEHDVTALTAKAQGLLAKGFRNVKMRTGLNPEYDRAAVRAVQAGVEDHASILVDGAKRYPLDEAIDMARFLGDEGVLLFEEPFKPGQLDDYVALAQAVEIPIAQGENEFGVEGFRELFRAGCVGVAQPDACRTGGITETVRIARLAAEFGIPVITHTWSDAISVVANAHVVAAMPNGRMVEINQTDNPLVENLLATPLQLDDGKLVLPPGPGLGIELDEDLVDELTLPPGAPVPLGHYSDMTFGDEYDWMWEPYPAARLVERPELSRS